MSTDPILIRDAVTADSILTGLLAANPDGSTALYPVILPQDPPLPAIAYFLVTQPTDVTQDSEQYRSPRWRFRIYSLIYGDLIPIAERLAAIFGDQAVTPWQSSRIEYPPSNAEGHETDTHRYWRAVDVVVGSTPAGVLAQ